MRSMICWLKVCDPWTNIKPCTCSEIIRMYVLFWDSAHERPRGVDLGVSIANKHERNDEHDCSEPCRYKRRYYRCKIMSRTFRLYVHVVSKVKPTVEMEAFLPLASRPTLPNARRIHWVLRHEKLVAFSCCQERFDRRSECCSK